jgi:hypothetical protein
MKRRDFILSGCAQLAACAWLNAAPTTLNAPSSRINWARLITPNDWSRHRDNDPELIDFIRTQTSLNLDPICEAADPSRMEELGAYPLIFANWINELEDPQQRANLREYIARGGFLLVDACVNRSLVPEPDIWLSTTQACLGEIALGYELRALPDAHAIYTGFFTLQHRPPHAYQHGIVDSRWKKHPTYGVFVKDRMVAIISMNGLQCATDATPYDVRQDRMKLIVNIYVYVMTH